MGQPGPMGPPGTRGFSGEIGPQVGSYRADQELDKTLKVFSFFCHKQPLEAVLKGWASFEQMSVSRKLCLILVCAKSNKKKCKKLFMYWIGSPRRRRPPWTPRTSRTPSGSHGRPFRRPARLRLWASSSSRVQRRRGSAQQQRLLHHRARRPQRSGHPEGAQQPDRQHEEPRWQQEAPCKDLRRPEEMLPHEEER